MTTERKPSEASLAMAMEVLSKYSTEESPCILPYYFALALDEACTVTLPKVRSVYEGEADGFNNCLLKVRTIPANKHLIFVEEGE